MNYETIEQQKSSRIIRDTPTDTVHLWLLLCTK